MTVGRGSGANAARVDAAMGLGGGVEEVLEGVFEEIVAEVPAETLVARARIGRDCSGVARRVGGKVSVSGITSLGISATADDWTETLLRSGATSSVAGSAAVKDRSLWAAAGFSSLAASPVDFPIFAEW
jgi:hypothetical protein